MNCFIFGLFEFVLVLLLFPPYYCMGGENSSVLSYINKEGRIICLNRITDAEPEFNDNNALLAIKKNYKRTPRRTLVISLPKNIQTVGHVKKNVLTQEMFTKRCTEIRKRKKQAVFLIKHDYDLNGKTITIPNNCVLKFVGGSLNNGIVLGGFNTYIGDGFGKNLEFRDFLKYDKGIIIVDDLTNCETAESIDDPSNYNLATIINYAIERCIKEYGFAHVVFGKNKTYGFRSPLFLFDNTTIEGNGCSIIFPTVNSNVYSMDGIQAFLTNRKHVSIDGSINNYTTTIVGSHNIIVKNIVFANVDSMKNFGFYLNCERGLIAMYGAENVLIDNIVANNINTAHCAIWCINMKNFEVRNCKLSQSRSFDSAGAGGIWSTKSHYMHNVSIHDNEFAFFGDESINIEMKSCAPDNSILINNNRIQGSLLTTIHNYDSSQPIMFLHYSNNILEDVTGIVSKRNQGNPRLLLLEGDIQILEYNNNVISADSSISCISFYNPCHIKQVEIKDNVVKGNVGILSNNDAYIISCIVSENKNMLFKFKPNLSALKNASFNNNEFLIDEDIIWENSREDASLIIRDNNFKNIGGRVKRCRVGTNKGKFSITGNSFDSVIFTTDKN